MKLCCTQTWADTFISELNDTHIEADLRLRHTPPELEVSEVRRTAPGRRAGCMHARAPPLALKHLQQPQQLCEPPGARACMRACITCTAPHALGAR